MKELLIKTRSYEISKNVVWNAYKRVKSNKGTYGIDGQSIADFELDLKNNLYKIWNRMSSGSYFPPPVRGVEIPKDTNRVRLLGIPAVSDRIAQMVGKIYLEPSLENYFHDDSYGYRPKKSAQQAIGKARKRCWRYDWVIDLDIEGFFDNIDHELMIKAVQFHTKEKWILLYVERWLKVSMKMKDGELRERGRGTPQGGVISPLLANLFLHYAFDKWLEKNFPNNPFERYADDAVIHCKTEEEAKYLKKKLEERLKECKLELHPEKTKIVYCKDGIRTGSYPNRGFDFLGYTFRGRSVRSKTGKLFVGFNPALSQQSRKKMFKVIRNWKLKRYIKEDIFDLARKINPVIRGWINYYGAYYKSSLYIVFHELNSQLYRWAAKKYTKLRNSFRRGKIWMYNIFKEYPELFNHWKQFGIFKMTEQ